jgi:hypothetical protein
MIPQIPDQIKYKSETLTNDLIVATPANWQLIHVTSPNSDFNSNSNFAIAPNGQ